MFLEVLLKDSMSLYDVIWSSQFIFLPVVLGVLRCARQVGGWNSAPGWDPEVAGCSDPGEQRTLENPAETPKKKSGTSNAPWLRQVILSPCAYYIYTHTHILFGHPPFCGTQVECRLKRRTCGMERVVFDGFRHFWNLQYRSIFHRWFPWGNQHGNEKKCCKKAVEHSCTKNVEFQRYPPGSRCVPLLPGQRVGVAVMVFTWTSVNWWARSLFHGLDTGIGHISTWWLWHRRRQAGCKMWPFIRRRSSEWKRRCLSLKNVEGWEHLWGHWYAMIRV